MVVMLGKEPPFQRLVIQTFYERKQPSQLQRQCEVLAWAAKQRSLEDRRADTANLVVNALALGYMSTLIFWGVLVKVKDPVTHGDRRRLPATHETEFQSGKATYRAAPWSSMLEANLLLVVHAARALNEKCKAPPKTLEDYAQVVQEVEISGDFSWPGAAHSKYARPWLTRTRVVTEMRYHGILRLKLSRDSPLSLLKFCFPDLKDWVDRFALGFKVTTIGQLLELIGYDGPIEFLTIFLCFAGCPQVQSVGHAWLKNCSTHAKVALAVYESVWRNRPIPACIIPIVAEALSR